MPVVRAAEAAQARLVAQLSLSLWGRDHAYGGTARNAQRCGLNASLRVDFAPGHSGGAPAGDLTVE
jgi:hypothetical protein